MSNKIKNFEFMESDYGVPSYYDGRTPYDGTPVRGIEVFPESRELYVHLDSEGDHIGTTIPFSKKAWKQLGEIILGEFEDE